MVGDYLNWLRSNNVPLLTEHAKVPPIACIRNDSQYGGNSEDLGMGIVMGESCTNDGFSLTAKHGHDVIRAIHQLNQEGVPFSLQISFQAPQPPYVATQKYYEMYEVENMILPENLHDTMEHSSYNEMKDRADKHGLGNSTLLKRWIREIFGGKEHPHPQNLEWRNFGHVYYSTCP
jgi:hypothetical protein